jgi:co-chaperonin GroES (HSP10)
MIDIIPIDSAVVVEIKKIEEKTAGGLIITKTTAERDQQYVDEGVLVAIGDLAFFEVRNNGGIAPNIGDMVYFKKHSGILHENADKTKIYRIIQDIDVYAYKQGAKDAK